MKFDNIITELSEKTSSLKSKIESIPAKNLKTGKMVLESLSKLAFIQYVNDEFDDAEIISEKLSSIGFDNDYDYWTWIEFSISLRAQLALLKQDDEKYNDSVLKIKSVLDSGEGMLKKIRNNVHNRFMAGEGVELAESVASGENKDLAISFDLRLVYLMKLIKIKVLGGSPEYSINKVERDIEDNLSSMRGLLNKSSISKVKPFS
ncbi:DUF6707 family protein [Pantoea phytobeneficialis]|uniref:Uncharacterized protein n=1 Tax=Pantoea phytobeneficialis TaxID=2052056 RepID=A0AAP9KQC8_9GAMM|nr:DUF6707 family protein [Pantoea phytobeneficialis]MDO6410122.1 hypothetical protein [Pantoea phytobeneficialis]QGR07870.1 hypothetical protein CTZ24_16150 [Pantoea phytobeneficialis]